MIYLLSDLVSNINNNTMTLNIVWTKGSMTPSSLTVFSLASVAAVSPVGKITNTPSIQFTVIAKQI